MNDRLVLASTILSGAILLSAIIALGLASVGAKVERAGELVRSGTSVSFPDHLTLSTGNDRLHGIVGNNTALKVKQVK